MLRVLLLNFKKVVIGLIMAALIITAWGFNNQIHSEDFMNVIVHEETIDTMAPVQRECDIVIRVGEWGNETTCKPGKRIYIDNGISWSKIPTDIPIRKDNEGHYISEFDINKKVATKVYNELKAQGVNAKLQVATERKQDLNAAARQANLSNPKLYLSFHHNFYAADSTGYFGMSNTGDVKGAQISRRLTDSIRNNPERIPQRENRRNVDNYIGELSHLNKSTTGVLLELGFFSNKEELAKICSDRQTDYIAQRIAHEIILMLEDGTLN